MNTRIRLLALAGILIIHAALLLTRILDPLVYDIEMYQEGMEETEKVVSDGFIPEGTEENGASESVDASDDNVEADISIDLKLDYFTGTLIFSLIFHSWLLFYITRKIQPVAQSPAGVAS